MDSDGYDVTNMTGGGRMDSNLFSASEPGYDVWKEERHVERFWQRPTIDIENESTFPPETESLVPAAKVASMRLRALLPVVPAVVLIVVGLIALKKYMHHRGKK